MKTSTTRPALARLDICTVCEGACSRPARRGTFTACLACGGRGFTLALRKPVAMMGYALATRAEHIAVLALLIDNVPVGQPRYEGLRSEMVDEFDAVLAHCDEDVKVRANAALDRKFGFAAAAE